MSRVRYGVAVALAFGATALAAKDLATGPVPARLVRCRAESDVPCLQTRFRLTPDESRRVAEIDTTHDTARWRGRIGTVPIFAGAMSAGTVEPPLQLLIILDVSGSMRGEGAAFTRTTLKTFVRSLPPAVRVAVVPFESRSVAPRIRAARFDEPAAAVAQIDALPAPAGNTALYSAVVEGLHVVTDAVRAAAPSEGAVLVITDGANDVAGATDDPGLLAGPEGRVSASREVDGSGHRVWVMGVGENVDEAELDGLAGTRGEHYIVKLDPNLLARRLAVIGAQIRAGRAATFALPTSARFSLARALAPGVVQLSVTGSNAGSAAAGSTVAGQREPLVTRSLQWMPPVFAMPAFQGVADSTDASAGLGDVVGVSAGADRRWLLALFFALAAVALWVALPMLIWPAAAAARDTKAAETPRAAPAASAAASGAAAAPTPIMSSTGLRQDVKEAPPRSPTDVTAASARKVAGR